MGVTDLDGRVETCIDSSRDRERLLGTTVTHPRSLRRCDRAAETVRERGEARNGCHLPGCYRPVPCLM